MPGYKQMGALGAMMDPNSVVRPSERVRAMDPNSVVRTSELPLESDGVPPAMSRQPKYTSESLSLMMETPEMMEMIQDLSDRTGVPAAEIMRQLPNLPQDTLEMMMGDIFKKMR